MVEIIYRRWIIPMIASSSYRDVEINESYHEIDIPMYSSSRDVLQIIASFRIKCLKQIAQHLSLQTTCSENHAVVGLSHYSVEYSDISVDGRT
jgi:hypothetical protein